MNFVRLNGYKTDVPCHPWVLPEADQHICFKCLSIGPRTSGHLRGPRACSPQKERKGGRKKERKEERQKERKKEKKKERKRERKNEKQKWGKKTTNIFAVTRQKASLRREKRRDQRTNECSDERKFSAKRREQKKKESR